MDQALRDQVVERAASRCEYCCLPQAATITPHQIDHIRAQKHRGQSDESNLGLSCFYCNSYKGANVAGFDPQTDELTRLFNPRDDVWDEHFAWNGPRLEGKSAIGRTTIEVLRIHEPTRVEHRRTLMELGEFEAT